MGPKKSARASSKRSAEDVDDVPQAQKKAKTARGAAKADAKVDAKELTSGTDNEGNRYWEISNRRRVTVSEFKGNTLVNIREYYEKDGEFKPGSKGISLSIDQYQAFFNSIGAVNAHLKSKGIEIHDGPTDSCKDAKDAKDAKDVTATSVGKDEGDEGDEENDKDDEDDEDDE